jgi:hypothetical protein
MVPMSAPVPSGVSVPDPKPKAKADPTQCSSLPWRLVNEFEAAAMLGVSVKFLRHQRQLNRPPRYRKLNGTTIRYRLSDLEAYVAAQPGGGEAGGRERAPKARPR